MFYEERIMSQQDHTDKEWHKIGGAADDLHKQHLQDRIGVYAERHNIKSQWSSKPCKVKKPRKNTNDKSGSWHCKKAVS